IIVRPLPCALARGEDRIGFGREGFDAATQQYIDHEWRQSENPEPTRRLRVFLPAQALLLEIDQRARHCHCRLLSKVHIVPPQSEHFGDPTPGSEQHVDHIEQVVATSRPSATCPILPSAQTFTERSDLIDRKSLDRLLRLRRQTHITHRVRPYRVMTHSECEHPVED